MTSLATRPFFIVGQPRSGTTLLRMMLSSHPRLYIPAETGFLPFLSATPGRILSLQQTDDVLQQIGRLNRHWQGMVDEAATLYEGLPEPTISYLLDTLYRQKMGHEGERWGDKTPSYVQYIPEIALLFPSAQFIHVIRDGRDTTLSAMKKWGDTHRYMDSYYLLKRWVENVEAGRVAGSELEANRYLEVHYESLVSDPETVLRIICDFLEEPFDAAMLDHTRLARQIIGPSSHVEVRSPISTESVGRWREKMSLFDRKLANRLAGPTLRALGYEVPSLPTFTFTEQLRVVALAARHQALAGTRRLLYASGLLTLNRDKR